MTEGLVRTHGLMGARAVVAVARRRIEPADIAFALDNKHRMGWQTMANIRAVNMQDLRRACEKSVAVGEAVAAKPAAPAPPAPAPPPSPPDHVVADTLLRVLWAVAQGARGTLDLSEACRISRGSAGQYVFRLKAQGLMAGHANSLSGWVVTKAGEAALRKARR